MLVVFQLKLQQYVHSAACAGAQRSSFHAVEDNTTILSILRVNFYEVVVDVSDVCFYSIDRLQC